MSKRILVFGGLGFIGGNFVRWSHETRADFEIKIADGHTYAADKDRIPKSFEGEIRKAFLQKPAEYSDLVQWSDLVVNFAAETHNDNSLMNPEIFIDTNVVGTARLLEVCIKHDTPLIQISTDEVFGDFPLDSKELATEDYPFRPSSPYSASKASADMLVMAWVRSFGLKAIVTHCTNNFGPKQNAEKLIPNVISKIRKGLPIELYGQGKNVRDWIHVDDHSRAIATLIDKAKWGEAYNISSNEELTNLDLVNTICLSFEKPNHKIQFVEDRPGHDLRYGLDSSKMRKLGWVAEHSIRGANFNDF